MNQLRYFGAPTNDYDCGAYGSSSFNTNQCQTLAAPGTPDTGVGAVMSSPYLLVGVALITLSIVLALAARRKRRSHTH